jgi:hypothetical protein
MKVRDLIRLLTEHSPDTDVRMAVEIIGCEETFLIDPDELKRKNDDRHYGPCLELSGEPLSLRVEFKANE